MIFIKRDFLKTYQQQGANLNDPDQKGEFICGEKNNYHQYGNVYFEFDITVRKADDNKFQITIDHNTNVINRLLKNGFEYCFKEARLGTTGGADLEHNIYLGQFSTIPRVLTSKDG